MVVLAMCLALKSPNVILLRTRFGIVEFQYGQRFEHFPILRGSPERMSRPYNQPLCLVLLNHASMSPIYVQETGLAEKWIWNQMIDSLGKNLIDNRPEGKARSNRVF